MARTVSRTISNCLIILLLLAGNACFTVGAQGSEAAPAYPLNVRLLDDGRWIAWVDAPSGRTRVDIPQSRDGIRKLAETRGMEIQWFGVSDERQINHTQAAVPDEKSQGGKSAPDWEAAEIPARIPDETQAAPAPNSSKTSGAVNGRVEGKGSSDAEQVARLNQAIESDEKEIRELEKKLNHPEGEFVIAEREFQEADQRVLNHQQAVDELLAAGKPGEAEALKADGPRLQTMRDLARQNFDVAIQSRKLNQEQLAALQDKLRQEIQARARLTGDVAVAPGETVVASPAPLPTQSPAAAAPAPVPVAPVESAPADAPPANPATAPAAPALPGVAGFSTVDGGAAAIPIAPVAPVVNKELEKAKQQAAVKVDAAREADQEVKTIAERTTSLDRTIELEQQQVASARQRTEIAYQQYKQLEAEFLAKSIDDTIPTEVLKELSRKLQQAEERFSATRQESRERAERLSELQDQRSALQVEELAALQAAKEKWAAAQTAQAKVSTLKNPFSVQNILQWLLDHGVKILVILCVMLVMRSLTSVTTRKIVNLMVARGVRGTTEEREDRANTLAGVFHNAASVTIVVGGVLMICEEVGIAVGPLMGGAAVLGLAVAFGAQNLIRDYFYGFVILLENQYKINDVLKIGEISGQVERITLRMTVLRDIEGRVHFIPNGKIDSVTNMTHGWSRALLDIGVAYKEDVDQVMQVLLEVAADLRRDPTFGPQITDNAEMLGVDSFGDSSVNIRFFIKTRPLKQWGVRREMLRRIKRRFDELGIEIPYPHRTVYHHDATATLALDPPQEDEGWNLRKSA